MQLLIVIISIATKNSECWESTVEATGLAFPSVSWEFSSRCAAGPFTNFQGGENLPLVEGDEHFYDLMSKKPTLVFFSAILPRVARYKCHVCHFFVSFSVFLWGFFSVIGCCNDLCSTSSIYLWFIVHLEATFWVWAMTIDVSSDLESLRLFTSMSKEMFVWIFLEILNHSVDKITPAPPGI